jgi:signal transduction histidine kinase
MVAAERGDLAVQAQTVDVPSTCALLKEVFGRHIVAEGKTIECRLPAGAGTVHTDPVLLRRVLGNLLKNALEASEPGDTVTLTFGAHPRPGFEVHNASVMHESARVNVFQRSFSTKAAQGRGLGTYGSRLLVERYLGGRISFWSTADTGTVFRVELPGSPAE